MRQHPIILDCDLWDNATARKVYIVSDQVAAVQELNEEHSKVILKTGHEFTVIWKASDLMERL